jgi:hypothetical protein
MKTFEFELMMDGLIATLQEKLCVGVFSIGDRECEKFMNFIRDLDDFWNPDGSLSITDYIDSMYEVLDNFK